MQQPLTIALTLAFIIFIVFLLQIIIPGLTEAFYFMPSKALQEPWRFITSIFLHADFSHLFFNLYALILFGAVLERNVKRSDFLKIFFLSGLSGSLLYYLTILAGISPPKPALGASGAIYGILGAVGFLLPNLVVYVFFFPMRMKHAVIFWLIVEFIGTFNVYSGIASAAHLGGLIVGYLYARQIKIERSEEWWMRIAIK